MVLNGMLLLLALACQQPYEFPSPDAWQPTSGPGGPRVSFDPAALGEHCAYLTGDETDRDHHNLVVMHDGYLWMPWSPEDGGGGLTVYAFDDPCNPVKVGEAWTPMMRESHTMAFGTAGDRDYLAVDYLEEGTRAPGGVGFWDITDPTAPEWAGAAGVDNFDYIDAYLRVTLSTFWQGPYVYTSGGFNGFSIFDASDPTNPTLLHQFNVDAPSQEAGTFHVIGNVAMASSAGLARTIMYDVSDPLDPVRIPGGDFETRDRDEVLRNYYFANTGGKYGLFARKNAGGGPIIYDISDPAAPQFVSDFHTEDGSGGYIFRKGDNLFIGDSDFASIYDMSDVTNLVETARLDLQGDLDTITPIGNVAVLAVDDGAVPGQASAVVPWAMAPDTDPPRAELHFPTDGENWAALTTRVGVSFDEMVERASVFEGSFRVSTAKGEVVAGSFNVQENIVNFTPDELLEEDTTYIVELPAGGIVDDSGNAATETLVFRFSTGREVEE